MQSALLREELVRLRREAGRTQEQVAETLHWSKSKMIRIESGQSPLAKVSLDALLREYGVTSETRIQRLQELLVGARRNGWWAEYRDKTSKPYLDFVGYESGAAHIRQYHGGVFPGIMQTPEYAEALTAATAPQADSQAVVDLRMKRQAHLAERDPQPYQNYLIDQSVVLREPTTSADPAVQSKQLRHVVELARANERFRIQVVPFSAGFHPGLLSAGFTILEFEGTLTDALLLEVEESANVLTTGDEAEARRYRALFESILDAALTPDRSLDLMTSVAERLEQR